MTPAAKKAWIFQFATASTILAGSIIPSPAQAQDCVSGKLISEITQSGTYSCRLGEQDYTFNSGLIELENDTDTSTIDFFNSTNIQQIRFTNTGATDFILFNYFITSPTTESIDYIEIAYNQDPSLPPPLNVIVATNFPLPYGPSPTPLIVNTLFEPDTSQGTQTLTALTYTIHKSPAPLPLVGAGFAFGFSRKLRRRVRDGSGKRTSA